MDSYIGTNYSDQSGLVPERTVMDNPDRYPLFHRLTWGSSGLVLLEIYDLSATQGSRFTNISTRGRSELGARQMIVGFSVAGGGARRLLIRGISPSLRTFGLRDVLDDPEVVVYNGSTVVDVNNDWGSSRFTDQMSQLAGAVGAFNLQADARDSAILIRAGSGAYSVHIRAAAGAPKGVVLAEVYATDP